MGHYCQLCGRVRSNESFTGRGHRTHICKECQRLPRNERERIEQLNELFRFLDQSNISKRNVERLHALSRVADQEVNELASLLSEVARLYPRRRRRYVRMARQHRDLLKRLKEAIGDGWWDDLIADGAFGEAADDFESDASPLFE